MPIFVRDGQIHIATPRPYARSAVLCDARLPDGYTPIPRTVLDSPVSAADIERVAARLCPPPRFRA